MLPAMLAPEVHIVHVAIVPHDGVLAVFREVVKFAYAWDRRRLMSCRVRRTFSEVGALLDMESFDMGQRTCRVK